MRVRTGASVDLSASCSSSGFEAKSERSKSGGGLTPELPVPEELMGGRLCPFGGVKFGHTGRGKLGNEGRNGVEFQEGKAARGWVV